MFSLRQYLSTLDDPHGLTRTLGEVEVCRDANHRPLYSTGNSAVVFRIRQQGVVRSLRGYFRPMRHLAEIYGERLLPQELYLYTTPESGTWVDVVLGDWIEGENLQHAIAKAAQAGDRVCLATLSDSFDRLAAQLTSDTQAHGDLKPENIVVATDGQLHLIDLDATFLPAFAGQPSPELGTAAYQHPARTAADFHAALDDFPAALISTALHALRLDPTLYDRYDRGDGLLFTPQKIHSDPALHEALTLFEQQGAAVWYRIARTLLLPTLQLFGLPELLRQTQEETPTSCPESPLELFVEHGLWGYRTDSAVVIPPLYDCGFDFTEGVAAVQIGSSWHFIDPSGQVAIRCPGCQAAKPFREGRAQLIRQGQRIEIDHTGEVFVI